MVGVLDFLGLGNKGAEEALSNEPMTTQEQLDPYEAIDAETFVSYVQDEFKRRETDRMPYEVQWRLNTAFIEGNQYLDINPVANTIEEVPRLYWWQEREVFNHIAPNVETRIARLSKMRPVMKAMPGSNEKDDLRRTKVTTQLLKNIYYDQKIKDKVMDVIPWLESTGTVLFKHFWNPDKGPAMEMDQITEGGIVQQITVREGDLDVVVCPAMEIYPDSAFHQEISECKSIIHAKAYHVQDINDMWGVEVTPEDSAVLRMVQSMSGQGGLGVNSGYSYSLGKLKDHAIVKEYWEIPSKKWPDGRLIIIANGKLLHFGRLPYLVGKDGEKALPFTKATCIKRPGCFWGKTVTERLIPIQRRYNALRNRKAEFLNSVAIGQWAVEKGAVDIDSFENDAGSPGFIAEYEKGFSPPSRIQNSSLPNDFDTEERTLLQEFSILSGVSEISRQSQAPTGVKSGVALSLALEQDETRLSATAGNIEEFLVESAGQWLRLYKQYVNGYRILKAVGKNNVVDVYEWTGSDLKAEDIVIEPISALSESPAQRRQMVFDLLNAGIFNDPESGRLDKAARIKVLEALEFMDWENIDSAEQLHVSKAERENRAMSEGMLQLPAMYDDHLMHIKIHNEYRLSTEAEELLEAHPEVAKMFELHVAEHARAIIGPMQPQPQQPAEQQM